MSKLESIQRIEGGTGKKIRRNSGLSVFVMGRGRSVVSGEAVSDT